jgi:hypothetical protein
LFVPAVRAQTDPTLSGLILSYTEKAEKQLKSQEKAMAMQTTGHIWIAHEVEETSEAQQAYTNYLDSFRDIVCYVAQIYGFYVEIEKLLDGMAEMNHILQLHPQGSFAVALSSRRNVIYRNLLLNSVEIVNDIRKVCLANVKMTEKQRIEIVFNIRPKLVKMNKELHRLTKAIKYTTFGDVWEEIRHLQPREVDKLTITRNCMARWKRRAKVR